MAAAAMLSGTTMMTSCEKEEEISKREVIESEVLDEGVAQEVTEEVGTEGTQLSYESWIVVRGQTRAAFQNKVSVTLFNRFNHVIDEVEVENFDFGQPEVGISYQTSDSRKEQDYVTVVDSVLVYSLKYENGFVLEYELMYEVPTYDDGVTEKEMPYIRYGAIVDNGMTVTGMDNLTENGQTWLRKLVRHSISVVFNDKSYTIEASVVAKSLEKAGDVLLASKKVNEGVEPVSVDAAKASGTYKSWIEVEQTWSESGTKIFKKEALLKHYVLFPQEIFRFDAEEKYAVLDDISLEISTDPQIREEGTAVDGVAIDVYKEDQRVEMRKNDDEIWCTVGRKRSTMRASPAGRQNTNSALPSSTATTFILPNFHGFWNTENGNKRKFQQKNTIPQGWCFLYPASNRAQFAFPLRSSGSFSCFPAPQFRPA